MTAISNKLLHKPNITVYEFIARCARVSLGNARPEYLLAQLKFDPKILEISHLSLVLKLVVASFSVRLTTDDFNGHSVCRG